MTEEQLLKEIIAAVRTCGTIILNADRTKSGIDEKAGHANFVTAVRAAKETVGDFAGGSVCR